MACTKMISYSSLIEVMRWWLSRDENAAGVVEEADGRVEWSPLQPFALEGNALILAVDGETERALVHVEEDAQDAQSLEILAVLLA